MYFSFFLLFFKCCFLAIFLTFDREYKIFDFVSIFNYIEFQLEKFSIFFAFVKMCIKTIFIVMIFVITINNKTEFFVAIFFIRIVRKLVIV